MKKLVSVSFLFLTLAACSGMIEPTQVELPASTIVSTRTVVAALIQTSTPLLSGETPDDVSAPLSESQPASEWNGIPIMPGATAGEGDEEGYVFTISVTPAFVQEYYQLELGKLGWHLFSQERDDSSMTLLYMNNDAETLTVSILAKDDDVLVLLVK